ncbi:MAG: SAM-dependent methyltransferase [Clostridiaceae bacterium]|nr:SAM-dependent methyltransferase [Clostridiaceae bacterium]
MVLKGRLKLIYDMIPPCDILSDIGTDHALIPAFALLNGRCKKAIACDIKPGPLERAESTRRKYMLTNSMELRMGSGLEPVREEEADVIVMAGMGGALITQLILKSINIAKKANCILLQPMTNRDLIRPFLWENGFEIIDEGLACEGNKLYLVISARYTGIRKVNKDRIRELIGDVLIRKNNPLLKDWVIEHIRKQRKAVNGLKRAKAVYDPEKIETEERLLKELTELLNSLGG